MENRLAAIPPLVETTNLTSPAIPATEQAPAAKEKENNSSAIGIATGSLASQIASGQIDEADLRLVIEEDRGAYIYKTINRTTGETLAQYPREEVVKMRDASDYTAGRVVNAKI